jgi:hypothetical protein
LQREVELEARPTPSRGGSAEQSTLIRRECGIAIVGSRQDLAKVLVNLRVVVDD